MKKLLILPALFFLLLTPAVQAVDVLDPVCRNAGGDPVVCQDNESGGENPIVGRNGILTRVVNILSIVVGIAAVIVVILAGMRMVTSGGDSSSVATARQSIIYAAAALAFVAASQLIVRTVLNRIS